MEFRLNGIRIIKTPLLKLTSEYLLFDSSKEILNESITGQTNQFLFLQIVLSYYHNNYDSFFRNKMINLDAVNQLMSTVWKMSLIPIRINI